MPGHDPSRPDAPDPAGRRAHPGAEHAAATRRTIRERLDELDAHIHETGHQFDLPGDGLSVPPEARHAAGHGIASTDDPAPIARDPRELAPPPGGTPRRDGRPVGGRPIRTIASDDPRAARAAAGSHQLSRAERFAWREERRREAARRRRQRRMRWLAPLAALVMVGGGAAGFVVAGGDDPASPQAGRGNDGEINADLGAQTAANGPLAVKRELGGPGSGGPVLQLDGARNLFEVDWDKPPTAGLVFDLDDGRVLWRKNPLKPLPIASVTKMMTALVVTEKLPPEQKIRITKAAINTDGSKVGVLPEGRWIGQSAMLHGLMLASGNDAAAALARQAGGGSIPRFVRMMNSRAKRMGLPCTRFSSPSGLLDEGNHSCAADLAVLARAVLDDERLAPIVGRRQAVLPFPIKGGKLYLYNHNPLLKENYPGVIGVKTGYTDAAGKTFVAAVKHKGHRYGVVLLHSPDIKTQAEQLLQRTYRADV
ncbi:MAG: D-alanyl-D-alanine carboxypeptidase [Solirubrobacteraceae bacterium]|nr:D-alanyl-D-alanine carboxypeptidase [Solirubrobacteraceae bacterium]